MCALAFRCVVPNRLAIEPVYYRLYCGGDSVVSPIHIHTESQSTRVSWGIYLQKKGNFLYIHPIFFLWAHTACAIRVVERLAASKDRRATGHRRNNAAKK